MMSMKRDGLCLSAALIVIFSVTGTASDDRWPQFRGPDALGVSEEAGLPESWSTTENVAWVTDIAGLGWSSPIVWDDTVYVTSVVSAGDVETPRAGLYLGGERSVPTDEHRWVVHGIDVETGAIKWEREVHRGVPHTGHHLKNTFASATPVTDGDRVYAYFGNVGLFCLSLDGRLLWSLPIEASATRLGWGMGASPVLHDDRIYIVNDNDDQSYLVALSKETGAELWRVDRDEGTNWSTPYIWENDRRTEIVTTGTGKVRSYDLDGNLLWELTGMSSITVTTPFSRFGLLYISSGYIGDRKRPGLGDPTRGQRGHHCVRRADLERVDRLVSAAVGVVQPVAAHLRRLLLHPARPGVFDLSRCADRRRGVRSAADRGRRRVHVIAVGLRRQDLRVERGWRHVRHQGGHGVRGVGDELAW